MILSLCHYSRLFTCHWLCDYDHLLEQDLPTDDVLVRSYGEQNIDWSVWKLYFFPFQWIYWCKLYFFVLISITSSLIGIVQTLTVYALHRIGVAAVFWRELIYKSNSEHRTFSLFSILIKTGNPMIFVTNPGQTWWSFSLADCIFVPEHSNNIRHGSRKRNLWWWWKWWTF